MSADSTSRVFDHVLRADSSLVPAVIHQLNLAVLFPNRDQYYRSRRIFDRYAPEAHRHAEDVSAAIVWGPRPADTVFATDGVQRYRRHRAHGVVVGVSPSTRDVGQVLDLIRWATRAGPGMPAFSIAHSRHARMPPLAWADSNEALPLIDSLMSIAPGPAAGAIVGPIGLGSRRDPWRTPAGRLMASAPAGALERYGRALLALSRGDVAAGRREVQAGLALGDTIGPTMRGMLTATGGWASLVAGDTAGGVRQLRQGIGELSGPFAAPMSAFLRFQLALALSARPETRDEGIRWLRFAFDDPQNYLIPLTYLALGRAWDAAGQRDSALYAYGKFVRFWDKADAPLQGRVKEAREAMARLSAEPRGN